jgi:hypothetical protein
MLYFFHFIVLLIGDNRARPRYNVTQVCSGYYCGLSNDCFEVWLLTLHASRMTLNCRIPFLYLPSAGIPGIHHFSWYMNYWGLNPGFVHDRQVLYQPSHISSSKSFIKMLYWLDFSIICPIYIFLWSHKVNLNKKTYGHRGKYIVKPQE